MTRPIFVAVLLVALQAPQPAPEPTLAAAMARLQAKDPAGAARILEDVVKREPVNGRAWRNLGVAYQGTKDYDKANLQRHSAPVVVSEGVGEATYRRER